MITLKLSETAVGKTAVIKNIDKALPTRITELGFAKGSKIKVMFCAFSGDPVAYRVKDTTVALRAETASLIDVCLLKDDAYE